MKKLPYGSNTTLLEYGLFRLKKSKKIDQIIIATTTDVEDNIVVEIAEKNNLTYYRGSRDNVLDRFYNTAKENNLDIVIRVTSDCPFIDPELIDEYIGEFLENDYDILKLNFGDGYPRGFDFEIFRFSSLEKAQLNATSKYDREHVTPYLYNSQDMTKKIIPATGIFNDPNLRITVDTMNDYLLCCVVCDLLADLDFIRILDIIILFHSKPYLYDINGTILQKRKYDSVYEEVQDAIKLLKFQGMENASRILKSQDIEND